MKNLPPANVLPSDAAKLLRQAAQTPLVPNAPFQSTLPVAGERSLLQHLLDPDTRSFNPRSPLPGSEAT